MDPVWWEKDVDGRYRRSSDNFCKFFGIAHCQAPIGLKDPELFEAGIYPEYLAGDRKVITTARPSIIEERYPRGWLETIKTPVFNAEGVVIGIFGIARDITDRHRQADALIKTEQDYRSLAESSPDFILRFDCLGRLIYANSSAFAFWKCSPDEVYGRSPEEHGILLPRDAQHLSLKIGEIVATGAAQEIEYDWAADGASFHLHLHLVPEFDLDGKVSGVLLFGRDLSSLQDARNRLRESHDLLRSLALRRQQEQEEIRRDVTHRIHEELAQELSALRMHLRLLPKGLADADTLALNVMDDIISRCIARIRDMVKTLRPAVIDLGIVPALRWLADDFYRGLELDFSLALPDELPLDETCATFLFRSAQEALLNIALHAAATHIDITLQHQEDRLLLSIADNGLGFNTEAPLPEGALGLLSIAEQARHLGGQMNLRATPGAGTCLEISLPFRQKQQQPPV